MIDSIFREELAQVRPIDSEIASLAASLCVDMNLSEKGHSKPGTPNDMELVAIQQDEHIVPLFTPKRIMTLLALTSSIVVSAGPLLLITGNLGKFLLENSLTPSFCCRRYWGRKLIYVAWNGLVSGYSRCRSYRGLNVRLTWSPILWDMRELAHHDRDDNSRGGTLN
jgi:hypothetical protein